MSIPPFAATVKRHQGICALGAKPTPRPCEPTRSWARPSAAPRTDRRPLGRTNRPSHRRQTQHRHLLSSSTKAAWEHGCEVWYNSQWPQVHKVKKTNALSVQQVSEGEMQYEALFERCEAREPLNEQNLGCPRNGEARFVPRRSSGDIVPKWRRDSGRVETLERRAMGTLSIRLSRQDEV